MRGGGGRVRYGVIGAGALGLTVYPYDRGQNYSIEPAERLNRHVEVA